MTVIVKSNVYDLHNLQLLLSYWLISNLIPKKFKKFDFWKNFMIMCSSVKNRPKNDCTGNYPNLKFWTSFSNFSKIASAKSFKISYWGRFLTLKTWLKMFPEIRVFQIFGN